MQNAASLFASLVTLGTLAAQTASPAAQHAMHLVKLPNGDYTVPLRELQGSGTSGKVVLHPQGPRTIVTVFVFGNAGRKHTFSLHSGSDCTLLGVAGSVPLAPALTGQRSQTLVSLPIASLTSKDYVIAAQNATARDRFKEACARL